MAKFPTMDEFAKSVAEKALDEYVCEGKTLRQWVLTILSGEVVPVVRCAKCKWYIAEFRVCQFWHGSRQPNHFCGEGERKVND